VTRGVAETVSLPPKELDAIIRFCRVTTFVPTQEPGQRIHVSFEGEEKPLGKSFQFAIRNPHVECDAIRRIAKDPLVVEVARRYLAVEPILLTTQLWWSYPCLDLNQARVPEYGFHYDIDDYKFLKLFFYLTDVDADSGPHVVIESTHVTKGVFGKLHRRITDEQAQTKYGSQVRALTGKAGTGFFEDTFCFHKGLSPSKRRLALVLEYAIHDFEMQG